MNKLITISGKRKFTDVSNKGFKSKIELKGSEKLEEAHVATLVKQLESFCQFWEKNPLIGGALISVYYGKVIPKTARIQYLFKERASNSNDAIRGVRFCEDGGNLKHVFTYFVSLETLRKNISELKKIRKYIEAFTEGCITNQILDKISNEGLPSGLGITKSRFLGIVMDLSLIIKFHVDQDVFNEDTEGTSIVTLYQTKTKVNDILQLIGLDYLKIEKLDECTLLLTTEQLRILYERAPYLISMQVKDLSRFELPDDDLTSDDSSIIKIPAPSNEPVVGVIDTLFDESVYFNEWVEYKCLVPEALQQPEDKYHGTGVTSIIVDGPSFNEDLEDGCGRFRVKHFGVATAAGFSSSRIMKNIREIVAANPEIKVWNLSLGSDLEISNNYVSPEGAMLDSIQTEYDVVFVVAGTNKKKDSSVKIGAPADSLNAIVVNAVNRKGEPASYTRVGPVLHFFTKPDLCCFGGDVRDRMTVCSSMGERRVCGTSYAAPWITRKVAYLIYKMNFNKEVAKALLIDAAAGWNTSFKKRNHMGYGVVPQRIYDILATPDNEIRFVLTHTTQAYKTYTYDLPIPSYDNHFPFFARWTLCYYPTCSRRQGVDYTNTEMDVQFGRVKDQKIRSVGGNTQDDENERTKEIAARQLYEKWKNVKHVSEKVSTHGIPRKQYGEAVWGLSITTKERLKTKRDGDLTFAVVVTLREMKNRNRCNEFIQLCQSRGWLVSQVNIELNNDIYVKGEEFLHLEDDGDIRL